MIGLSFLILFAGLRGNVGYDTCDYKELFSESLVGEYPYIEFGFLYFTKALALILPDAQLYLLVVSLVQGVILYNILKNSRNPRLLFIIFVCVFYYPFFFTTLRNGLAILIFGLTYVLSAKYRYYWVLPGIASTSIHFTAIPSLILIPRLARFLPSLVAIFLCAFIFAGQSFVEDLGAALDISNIHTSKLIHILDGAYAVDESPAIHRLLIIPIILVFMIMTIRGVYGFFLVLFYFATAVSDLYIGLVGRLTLYSLFALFLHTVEYWHTFDFRSRLLLYLITAYFAFSNTIYPIALGDERILKVHAEKVRTTAGSYHLWIFNDRSLCQY